MTESALVGWSNNAAAYTVAATLYMAFGGCCAAAGTTEANCQLKFRGAGTLQNARIYVAANTWNSAATARTRISGANGNSSISVTASTTGTFADTTHTDSLADGNLWNGSFTLAGSGSMNIGAYTAELVITGQAFTMFGASNASTGTYSTSSATTYDALMGQSPGAGVSNEALIESFGLENATLSNIQFLISTNGNANAATGRSRKNTANGNQSVSITAGVTGLYEDTTHTDSIVATDKFCGAITTGASTVSMRVIAAGCKYLGAAAGTVAGEINANGVTFNNGGTYYNPIIGKLTAEATEVNSRSPFPFAGSMSKLAITLTTNNSSVASTLVLRKSGVDQNNTVSVTGSTTGLFRDTTHSDTFAAADLITTKHSGNNSSQVAATIGSLITSATANAYTLAAASASYSISGTAVALKRGRDVPAASGSYAITGTALAMRHGFPLTAASGSYSLSGTAAALRRSSILVAAAGSYALTGTAVALKRALLLVAGAGGYAISGTAALLRRGYPLAAAAGAYALNGTALAFRRTYVIAASAGAYAISGTAATLKRGAQLAAAAGAYILTGTPLAFRLFIAAFASGAYALTGAAVGLVYTASKTLTAEAGGYAISGSAAALTRSFRLLADAAAYSLAGTAAALKWARRLAAGAGTYALTGTAAALVYLSPKTLAALAGAYTITGAAVALKRSLGLPAGAGAYDLTGTAAALRQASRAPAAAGGYTLTGTATGLFRGWTLLPASGAFALSGAPAALRKTTLLSAGAGAYQLVGRDVRLRVLRPIPSAALEVGARPSWSASPNAGAFEAGGRGGVVIGARETLRVGARAGWRPGR